MDWNEINTELLKNKDKSEIEKLYLALKPFFMFRYNQNEELFNNIVLKVVSRIKDFNSKKGEFDNWVFKIAEHECVDFSRTNNKFKSNVSIDAFEDGFEYLTAPDVQTKDDLIQEEMENLAKYAKKEDIDFLLAYYSNENFGKKTGNEKLIAHRLIKKIKTNIK